MYMAVKEGLKVIVVFPNKTDLKIKNSLAFAGP